MCSSKNILLWYAFGIQNLKLFKTVVTISNFPNESWIFATQHISQKFKGLKVNFIDAAVNAMVRMLKMVKRINGDQKNQKKVRTL